MKYIFTTEEIMYMEELKKSPYCKTIRLLLIILLFPIINIIVQSYQTYNAIQETKENYDNEVRAIKNAEWMFISGILKENKEKAKMQAEYVRDRIENRLLDSYKGNMDQLKEDLNSNNDNLAYRIMNEEITGKYLNINNDNNDMFIATNKKVIVDKSINCAVGKLTRSWDEEVSLHSNKNLASNSIKLLVNKSTVELFWQFLPSEIKLDHEINYPNIDELKTIFKRYGIDGLKPYEFLAAAYIKQDSDIFNVPDVNLHGIKNDNDKLIVVQGFSLYDTIQKDYLLNISYFIHLEDLAEIEMKNKKSEAFGELVMNVALLITSFMGIFLVSQMMIKWGGDDAIRGCKG
jgi:hypothetical protein